jgi:hypothetical protein
MNTVKRFKNYTNMKGAISPMISQLIAEIDRNYSNLNAKMKVNLASKKGRESLIKPETLFKRRH